jgi:2-methylisocitrate lyase-like PEP mutase family enzyme
MSTTDAIARFRALHERRKAFIIPNPWDVGSARLLADAGFEALATTSAGYAWSVGKPDGGVGRDEMLEHCARIVGATPLPVNADLENCYADEPSGVAQTIRMAAGVGLAGASIEDASGDPAKPIYEFDLAVERVRAGVEANRAQPTPMLITARAENLLHGRKDLADTIRRLQAFEAAGADVLYAPGLATIEDIRAVIDAVNRPVNVLMSSFNPNLTLAELEAAGARRISVGGSLARAAYGEMLRAAAQMKDNGIFTYVQNAPPSKQINGAFARWEKD